MNNNYLTLAKEKMDKAQAYIECTFTAAKKKNVVLNSMRDILEM